MRNYDYIFILMCLFVLRVTLLSGSFADVLCLIGVLAYHLGNKIIENNKITNEALVKIESNHELTQNQIKVIAEEVNKAKTTAEGVKAAINFNKR
jgi:hypothetical protein